MTRAIVLAAGAGSRLMPYTADRPKCMVELLGRALIEWQLAALRTAGIGDITIVTGYRADRLQALGVATRHNAEYASSNMVYSLMCARDLLDGDQDVLVVYADIVYEARILDAILGSTVALSITVDRNWQALWSLRNEDPMNDAETLRLDASGNVIELGKKPQSLREIEAQYMGLIKIRADHAAPIVAHYRALAADADATYDGKDAKNMYMTSFLQSLIDAGHPVRAVCTAGGWLEVDTTGDLETYERLQANGQLERLIVMSSIV